MLVIRLQRTGRKGHAQFRVVVQDSRRTPTSGKIVALVGTYDPHSKAINLNKERAQTYLDHGAQPSPRVVTLLKAEGIKLPKWVKAADKKEGKIRNPEKLRRNRPADAEAMADKPAEAEPVEAPAESTETEAPAETPVGQPEVEAPAQEDVAAVSAQEPSEAPAPAEEAATDQPAEASDETEA